MSDTRRRILQYLSRGEVISGSTLAEYCGVSRAAVWKHIKGLRADGLPVDVVTTRGYQIRGGLSLFDYGRISAAVNCPVVLLEETASTNDWLMSQLAGFDGKPRVCLSERQRAGRGTKGRAWESPAGSNIYCSFYWRSSRAVFELGGLSLAVAVSLVERLRLLNVFPVMVKWPNDLHTERGKLGGILVDMLAEVNGPVDLVIGVGLNVGMPEGVRQGIDQDVADVHDFPQAVRDRSEIVIALIGALADACEQFESSGFAAFLPRWEPCDMTWGRDVKVLSGHETIRGVARGVTGQGMIRIETGQGVRVFPSGDVSLEVG